MKSSLTLMSVVATLLLTTLSASAKDWIVTSVYSETDNGYVRKKLPDGSFQRQYYAIADGGYSRGETADPSIDDVKFPALAGLIAEYLAKQNYYFAHDTKQANLLLVIWWGTTIPGSDGGTDRNAKDQVLDAMNGYQSASAAAVGTTRTAEGIESPQMAIRDDHLARLHGELYQMQLFNTMRRQADLHNARLLGYLKAIDDRDNITRLAGGDTGYEDLISDVEEPRYYVILGAYDFRAATQQHKKRLLWITRISIQAQGNQFNQELPAMLADAARYFGRPSGGLIRGLREGSAKIGKLKVLGYEPATTAPATTAKKSQAADRRP